MSNLSLDKLYHDLPFFDTFIQFIGIDIIIIKIKQINLDLPFRTDPKQKAKKETKISKFR